MNFLKRGIVISMAFGVILLGTGCTKGESSTTSIEGVDKKVITVTVSATEVMDKLNVELLGVPKTASTLPERYKGLPQVGGASEPNFEVIVSLAPDLLVVDNSFKDKVAPLSAQYGIETYFFNTSTFTNFKNSILEISTMLNRAKEGKSLISELETAIKEVKSKGKINKINPKVAVIFGTSESYMLATDLSYVGDLLENIGIENVTDSLTNMNSAYYNFSQEQLLTMNPDIILRLSHGDLDESKKAFDEEFAENPAWSNLTATKEGKVYDLDPKTFGVSTNLRVVEGITRLGEIIYGQE